MKSDFLLPAPLIELLKKLDAPLENPITAAKLHPSLLITQDEYTYLITKVINMIEEDRGYLYPHSLKLLRFLDINNSSEETGSFFDGTIIEWKTEPILNDFGLPLLRITMAKNICNEELAVIALKAESMENVELVEWVDESNSMLSYIVGSFLKVLFKDRKTEIIYTNEVYGEEEEAA